MSTVYYMWDRIFSTASEVFGGSGRKALPGVGNTVPNVIISVNPEASMREVPNTFKLRMLIRHTVF
jgi:hypothetical protein